MAIQRWDPLRELLDVQQRINRLFDDAFSRSTHGDSSESTGGGGWKPTTDLIEQSDSYILRADLPGVSAKDVEIRIEDGTLVLHGERRRDSSVPQESYLRMERPSGKFELRVTLAPSVDAGAVIASHRNGVIEIRLPKKRVESPSTVEITTR